MQIKSFDEIAMVSKDDFGKVKDKLRDLFCLVFRKECAENKPILSQNA